jgi:glycosyltransferase involved in cell wall biosynthesis
MKKLSVITINLNNAKGLLKTIESVVSQTYSDFEFIIIDGGSKDDSLEIIKQRKNKINTWISEPDSGIYDAMNKGIAKANGEYCLFLNSGDYLNNKETLTSVFKSPVEADILYGELIFDNGGTKRLAKQPDTISLEYLFNENIWHPSTFVKRDLFQKIGNYKTVYKIASDYDFFFNAIVIKKASTHYLNFPISVYDTTGISSDSNNIKLIREERNHIHLSYLSSVELEYLNNVQKFKNKSLAKWLVSRPRASIIFNKLLSYYSAIRN